MNIKEFYKKLKYWQKGLLIGILIGIIRYLISFSQSYNGNCGNGGMLFFGGPPSHSCSLLHYLFLEPFEDRLMLLVLVFGFLVYTIPFVVIGYGVDIYKRMKQKNMKSL